MANTSIYNAFERMWAHVVDKVSTKAEKTYVDSQNTTTLNEAKGYTDEKVGLLMNNSSEAVDSVMELAAAMENNKDAIDALTEIAGKKVDKVDGKGLSTNDYTTEEKNKLAGIAAGAEVNVQSDWNATEGDALILNKPAIPSKTSELTNDSNFATEEYVQESISQSDWNQTNESAPDYIKNKPFGKYEGEIIDHEETITGFEYRESNNYYIYYADNPHTDIISDQPNDFIIYFDDVRYEVTKGTEHSTVNCSVGNYSIVDNTQEDTGEPFFIAVDIDLVAGGYLFDTFYTTLEGDSHTIKIAHIGEVIQQLPIEYLPEHTHVWNDIEDRPFGEFEGEITVIEETTINSFEPYSFAAAIDGVYYASGIGGQTWHDSLVSIDGECIVYFDGVPYECRYIENGQYIGNSYIPNGSGIDTGEPFLIEASGGIDETSGDVYLWVNIYTTLEGTSHTLSITKIGEVVRTIPERYLPEVGTQVQILTWEAND